MGQSSGARFVIDGQPLATHVAVRAMAYAGQRERE
jgi:hypothetical protein